MDADGIYRMVEYDSMYEGARRYWDFVNMVPGAPLVQTELNGFYSLDKWKGEGFPVNADPAEFFSFTPVGRHEVHGCGGVEAGFVPLFKEEILEKRGKYELVRDIAGRSVLYFANRRSGFMPEYVDHPVKDEKTWEELCKWRMDPASPQRQADMDAYLPGAIENAKRGMFMSQHVVGGYMYLRALIGPLELLYMVYDRPKLIHDCMETWFRLADNIVARHQEKVSFDEFFIGEDICYKNGSLISPDMIKEFLLPYYQQLIANMTKRRLDKSRPIRFQVDTDGYCDAIIDLYRGAGMDYLNPFEVAAGCDVARTAREYPDMRVAGGIDKRILAQDFDAIDKMVDSILPAMRRRGGYLVSCDHGVPEEVPLENYLHFRKRCMEIGN